ncbi:MAG: hypothetical protein OHK93_002529 [Ramalina farinacea]|uniref:Aromatic amino acid beta-eliminating lyase/threonine aldolase domain-containing protein n=1 Tax=Ramalina farinacea TaxID=258253 RepID=A0AA43QRL9_9LECA|nr:hypothetical protein [Ramalina farinacea]
MLAAIANTTLLDDVFREDTTTNDLESWIADLTGHEAALLVMSGTMGNQLSIRTHLGGPPHSIVADVRSHIMGWEAGGLASLSGALAIPIPPSNDHHLTLPDIRTHTILSRDIHACPTRLISLENTLAGTILPLSSARDISAWARAQEPPIPCHLDGARLWEAVAANAGTLRDYCACFDSVSLCFSKGLGAPVGSMIVGSRGFIERARHLRKMLGGGTRQAGIITAPARVAVEETFLGGELARSHARAREIAGMWTGKGGVLERECETNMVWLDLGRAGVSRERFVEEGVKAGVKVMGGRLVVHYQIGEEGVRRLGRVMDAVLGAGGVKVEGGSKEAKVIEKEAERIREVEAE